MRNDIKKSSIRRSCPKKNAFSKIPVRLFSGRLFEFGRVETDHPFVTTAILSHQFRGLPGHLLATLLDTTGTQECNLNRLCDCLTKPL
jgi:hypothetical protein